MTADRWKRVQDLFLEAADLDPKRRPAFLDAACGADRELRQEIESLFQYDTSETQPLTAAVNEAVESLSEARTMTGRRIGPYRLTELLGSGGMGDVYLAVRDDGQFEMRVAIKFVRAGLDSRVALERFRHERQILARLDHPYIAKLLDGGTDEDGRPYLIMEYVEGTPIHAYCAARQFTAEQKCELFIKVCEAVGYAHRSLVIHRDLKPGNILVTGDGVPKLLDFGIARLLTPEDPATGTKTIFSPGVLARPLTPDYASPEQVRGEPLNTTTDVYSLGAVLFELLTGARPHEIGSYTTNEIERAVCLEEVRKPSAKAPGQAAKRLAGDLDNIVLMALRKEPQRRYQSAAELKEDLQRHLKGLPVRAREDTTWYRTGKFMRRHRFSVMASALVALALVGGIISTNLERRRADEQRDAAIAERAEAEAQRRIAVREHRTAEEQRDAAIAARQVAEAKSAEADVQRRRAEERAQALMSLANESLLKIHDEIAVLPGAIEVRKRLVENTLQYLDRMYQRSGDDPRLNDLVIKSYIGIAGVQGSIYRPSLGDFTGALQSFRKAEAILNATLPRHPREKELLLDAVAIFQGEGDLLRSQGREPDGVESYSKGAEAAGKLAKLFPEDRLAMLQPAIMHHALALILAGSGDKRASQHVESEIAIYSKLLARNPADEEVVQSLASAYLVAATEAASQNRVPDALSYARTAVETREALARKHPDDVLYQRSLLMAYGRMGDLSGGGGVLAQNAGDRDGAVRNYRLALAIAERLHAADSKNNLASSDLQMVLTRLGQALDGSDEIDESLASLRRAEALAKDAGAEKGPVQQRGNLALIYELEGRRLEAQGKTNEALAAYRDSVRVSEALYADSPKSYRSQVQDSYRYLALALAAAGNRAEALEYAARMRAHAEKIVAAEPENSQLPAIAAGSSEATGLVYARLAQSAPQSGDTQQAREWLMRARDAWSKPGVARRATQEIERVMRELGELPQNPQ
jgi:serine/threonine protein kinase